MSEETIIDDRFKVLKELGRGGMGAVFEVEDTKTQKTYALKVCASPDDGEKRRFVREATVMRDIKHPNVMRILGANLKHSPPYFVMPLARHSLVDELKDLASDEDSALNAFTEVLKGIEAIHKSGATHRDIKPLNILRLLNGELVVSDLGLAKKEVRDTTVLTLTHEWRGTEAYIAPEQKIPGGFRDSEERTDVYQLGKTLYHILTNENPTLMDLKRIPNGLAFVVKRATAENPDDRIQSVGKLRDAIEAYRASKAGTANPIKSSEALLQRLEERAQGGRYDFDVLAEVCQLIQGIDHNESVIDIFVKIPDQALQVLSAAHATELEPALRRFADAVSDSIGEYGYSFAETVASKMRVAFKNCESPELRAVALRALLCAAADLHRFAAMDVFDELIVGIDEPSTALAVSEMLAKEIARYEVLAGRVPPAKLHISLRKMQESLKGDGGFLRADGGPDSNGIPF